MKSIIESAYATVPTEHSFDVRDPAEKVLMKPPILVLALIKRLDPETKVISWDNLKVDSVTASAELGISSSGHWSFKGSAHQGGAWSHKYVFAMAFTSTDPASRENIVVANEGSLYGSFSPGERDDNWEQNGYNSIIADSWNIIKDSEVTSRLHTSDSTWTDIGGIVEGIFAGVVIGGIIIMTASGGSDNRCNWERLEDGSGVEYVCRTEF